MTAGAALREGQGGEGLGFALLFVVEMALGVGVGGVGTCGSRGRSLADRFTLVRSCFPLSVLVSLSRDWVSVW